MSIFDLKRVPTTTEQELIVRGGSVGTQWVATRYPWIHVISFSSACSEKFKVLKSFGGSTKLDQNLYQQDYARPEPGITSIKVKKKGELGTTREVSISLLAFTDNQLLELQKCLFIPGMTVRVQFGWSSTASGVSIPPVYLEPSSDPIAMKQMARRAAESPGYEGFQGMVTNFSYNLNTNNYWECLVTLVSTSDAFMESKVETSCCNCPRKTSAIEKKQTEERTPQFLAFLIDVGTKAGLCKNYPDLAKTDRTDIAIARFSYEGNIRNPDGSDPSLTNLGEFWDALKNTVSENAVETFISLGAFEQAINVLILPRDKDNKNSLGQLRSDQVIIRSHNFLESADPRVCLIPGTSKYTSLAALKRCFLAKQGSFVEGSVPVADLRDTKGIKLSNILLNTRFLASTFRQNQENIHAFLTAVVGKVNEVCGSLWEFDFVSSTDDGNVDVPTTTLVDLAAPGRPEVEVVLIPSNPSNSVVRDLRLDLKLTDAMKTQALYSNRTTTATPTCNRGDGCAGIVLEPFGLVPANNTSAVRNLAVEPSREFDTKKDCPCETVTDPAIVPKDNPKPTFDQIFADLSERVDDSSVSSAVTELVFRYAQSTPEQKQDTCAATILPFEFSFTVDGIGGFAWGQVVSSTRIPKQVRDRFHYQITAVEHEVGVQDWITTVNTVARYKPQKTGNWKPSAWTGVGIPTGVGADGAAAGHAALRTLNNSNDD